jgi:hypothetical protein
MQINIQCWKNVIFVNLTKHNKEINYIKINLNYIWAYFKQVEKLNLIIKVKTSTTINLITKTKTSTRINLIIKTKTLTTINLITKTKTSTTFNLITKTKTWTTINLTLTTIKTLTKTKIIAINLLTIANSVIVESSQTLFSQLDPPSWAS